MLKISKLLQVVLVSLFAGCGGGGSGSRAPAPVLTLTSQRAQVAPGQTTVLNWSATGARACVASGGWSGTKGTSGSERTTPITSASEFALRCTGAGGEVQASVSVDVDPSANRPPTIDEFASSDSVVDLGQAITFTWAVVDPDDDSLDCFLDVTGAGAEILVPDCGATQSVDYTYGISGTFLPALRVVDGFSEVSSQIDQQVLSGLTVDLQRPRTGALVGADVAVVASVTSALEVVGVVARVRNRIGQLVFSPSANRFEGTVDVDGLARGEQILAVEAENVLGERTLTVRPIVFDEAPGLVFPSPVDDAVATPSIRVVATCVDDDPADCQLALVTPGKPVEALGENAVDTSVDLSDFDGSAITIKVQATDSAGQMVSTARRIFVEGSPDLAVVQTVPGRVLEVQNDRILYRISQADGDRLRITDFTGSRTDALALPADNRLLEARTFLTPGGAIFVAQNTAGPPGSYRLFDWDGDQLEDLGVPNSTTSLAVAGRFAIWNSGPSPGATLTRRDTVNRTQTVIATNAGNVENAVASNGAVAYWTRDYQIGFFSQGVTNVLTDDVNFRNTYVRTDGSRAVYRKADCCDNQVFAIAVHDGSGEQILRSARAEQPAPGRDYQIVPGWVAYTDFGNLGQTHVWLLDPQGQAEQITFFGESSRIDALGGNGEVMFSNAGKRYLGASGGVVTAVGASLGKAYHTGDQWYVAIGNTVFRVLL